LLPIYPLFPNKSSRKKQFQDKTVASDAVVPSYVFKGAKLGVVAFSYSVNLGCFCFKIVGFGVVSPYFDFEIDGFCIKTLTFRAKAAGFGVGNG